MPQRERVKWAQLRVGIMVIVSLVIFAVAVFFISGQVGFLTSRYMIKAYFSGASGLREGAQVRLAGIAVGNVSKMQISPYTDPQRAVELTLKIARRYQNEIRADSVATVETVGLLGESYVNVTRGTPGQDVVADGGTVKTSEEADIKAVVQNANDVISNLRVLSSKLNEITAQIQTGKGSMGKLIYDQALYNKMSATTGSMQDLMNRVQRGEGTLGKLMSDETLYNRTVATLDRLNQVVDDVQHGNGTLAKFISDPSVYNNVNKVVKDANTLIDNVNQGHGSLGKLAKDEQLYNRLNETFDRLNVITTRIEQGQGTLGKLSTDPTLFNNLTESSQSLKEFLTDFRKNPKKYLTIRLHIF
ncbi:MAG: MlaD family protein [Acidobacteriia bacterium]|nr:MlaD family protein [Terriglobia bacterium]